MKDKYSDLQVVGDDAYPKYVVHDACPKYVVHEPPRIFKADKFSVASEVTAYNQKYQPLQESSAQPQPRRICGMTATAFWISLAIAMALVVGAAVGGGIGAVLAKNKDAADPVALAQAATTTLSGSPTLAVTDNTAVITASELSSSQHQTSISLNNPTSTQFDSRTTTAQSMQQTQASSTVSEEDGITSSFSQPATTTKSQVISTSTIVGPSGTLYADCPSSNDTIYSPSSSTQQFRKLCGSSFVNSNGFDASITVQVSSLDDCITACAGFNLQNQVAIAAGSQRICNAACWRATGGDYSGWCYGYTTQNTTGNFNYGTDVRCDSAALINQ